MIRSDQSMQVKSADRRVVLHVSRARRRTSRTSYINAKAKTTGLKRKKLNEYFILCNLSTSTW